MIVDTHCHLEYYSDNEIEGLLSRCAQKGVIYLQNICVKLSTLDKVASFSYKYPNISCSIGCHPCEVLNNATSIEDLELHYKRHEAVINAVGETGLDYNPLQNEEIRALQREAFVNHAIFAHRHSKPLIIHLRGDGAEEDLLGLMANLASDGIRPIGVLHCFTGSGNLMSKMLDAGFYVSFSGIVTFNNAAEVRSLVPQVPKDRLLIETDSPYLSPHPFRGKVNEPSMVRVVGDYIRDLLKMSEEDFSLIIRLNYTNLFGVKLPAATEVG